MSSMTTCPKCGLRITGTDELCPRCLLEANFGLSSGATLQTGQYTDPEVVDSSEEHEFVPGQIIDGKYCLERRLGKGGMGSVHLATHLGTKRTVAM